MEIKPPPAYIDHLRDLQILAEVNYDYEQVRALQQSIDELLISYDLQMGQT